ncbi:MAG: hypothetical protein HY927_13610 [Elusimicrobia bacterium]|nr:hypothetical protein [Elusimicrobiota bacterium]
MKSHAAINGSSAGLAAIFNMENTAGFLDNRQRVIHLVPISQAPNMGYVWRRVFLRARDAL